jgi:hypothetical protein
MSNDPLKDRRDPTHHKWRPWEERHHLQEERRERRGDRIIRVIGEVVLLAITVMVLLAVVHFLSKIVTGIS